MEKKINATEKFCTKCGKKFIATGREVICPECKQAAQEETKRAAVMRAKKASWAGESVPVRISGRASAVIRRYGAANGMTFAESLDELLKASDYFKGMGKAWEDITPYKSRRRDKATSTTETAGKPQEVKQAASKPQDAPQTAQAAKTTSRTSTAKKAAGASKTAAKKGEKKA